ncbi:MAG: type III-B CRISPR module RAMP protein Cmr6 [Lentisphaeria bacterium]
MTICVTNELKNLLNEKLSNVESPSLRLAKLVNLEKRQKKNQLDAVVGCHNSKAANPISVTMPNSEFLYLNLGGRLIINQAGGVLENANINLHRHFGYPFIPGSAVKGVARHYAWELWNDAEGEKKEELALKIAQNFGFPTNEKGLDEYLKSLNVEEKSGAIAFHAAIPTVGKTLEVDILTSHHPDYYGGKKEKALDTESPVPLPFLTVKSGTPFQFQISPLKKSADLAWTKKMLKEALEINGIGAKTAAGYGWFVEDAETAKREEKKRVEAKIAAENAQKAAAEKARVASLSPEEQEIEVLKNFMDKFKEAVKEIATKNEVVQRFIINALKTTHKAVWDADKKDYEKGEKKGKRGYIRAKAVLTVAEKLGEKL